MRFIKTPLTRTRLKAILKNNKLTFKDFAEFCGYSAPGLSNSLLALKEDQEIKPILKYALLVFLLRKIKKIDPELLVSDLLET